MKAVILVAGMGTRLRPLTDNTPKPMLDVGGRPLLEWMIKRVKEAGIDEILLVTNYLEHKIIEDTGHRKRLRTGHGVGGKLRVHGALRRPLPRGGHPEEAR